MPAVEVCAAAPEGTPVSEAAIASAQAQTRVVIRISSGIPAVDYGSSDPGARYKGGGGIFKPSGSAGCGATIEISTRRDPLERAPMPSSSMQDIAELFPVFRAAFVLAERAIDNFALARAPD